MEEDGWPTHRGEKALEKWWCRAKRFPKRGNQEPGDSGKTDCSVEHTGADTDAPLFPIILEEGDLVYGNERGPNPGNSSENKLLGSRHTSPTSCCPGPTRHGRYQRCLENWQHLVFCHLERGGMKHLSRYDPQQSWTQFHAISTWLFPACSGSSFFSLLSSCSRAARKWSSLLRLRWT